MALPARPPMASGITTCRRRRTGDDTVDGRRIDAVVQLTKMGFSPSVFDRVTGKPVWPIDELPFPRATCPAKSRGLTQPFPDEASCIRKHGVSLDDAFDLTPELKAEAQAEMKKYRLGLPQYSRRPIRCDIMCHLTVGGIWEEPRDTSSSPLCFGLSSGVRSRHRRTRLRVFRMQEASSGTAA